MRILMPTAVDSSFSFQGNFLPMTIFLESIDESVILARFVRCFYNVVGVCRRPNQVQGNLDNENTSRVLPENISHASFKRNLP